MHYVYVLKSLKDGRLYKGSTKNLEERLERHQKGLVPATKHRLPLQLIYHEEYNTAIEAIKRERYIKTLIGGTELQKKLKELLTI